MKFHPMPRYIMRRHVINKIFSDEDCNNKSLLEFGYGAGDIFSTYINFGIKTYGYDFSNEAYNYVKENNKDYDKIVLYTNNDEIYSQKYDYVVACEVLEHIENDSAAIKEWYKLLNGNGKMLISVPAHKSRWGANDIYSGHFRRYEKKELQEMLKNSGLVIEKFYTYDYPSALFLDPLRDYRVGKKIKQEKNVIDKNIMTQKSGIARDENKIFRMLSNEILLYPIVRFQELFYNTDLGSAYIVLCSKK